MRITAMFHPLDRAKVERWAMSRGYGYAIEARLLSQGYLLAHVEAAAGSSHPAVVRDMIVNGIRVMRTPGVVMTSEEPAKLLAGMERLGGLVERSKKERLFPGGTRVRVMKRKRAGAELKLKKRARRLGDNDYYW